METQALILLVAGLMVGLVVGAVAGIAVARSRKATEQAETAATAADARSDLAAARSELAHAQSLTAEARGETERLRADLARNESLIAHDQTAVAEAKSEMSAVREEASAVRSGLAAAQAQRDAAVARAEELAVDRESLVNQFKALSAESLERQGKQVDATAAERLLATEAVMAPVKESLELMNQRIAEVERDRVKLSAELAEQVRTVTTTGETLRRETSALVNALRKPQVRGAWGETQLRRVAEITGMVERCDFDLQVTSNTNDGAKRPDMRVNLADGKCVFVDSKVPLSAFMDAFETEDQAERAGHLQRFGKSVRTHIDQLSGKSYHKLEYGSPEMVVLFLPSEAFLQAAVEQISDLQEYANRKNIVLATPSILIPLLRAVQHGWKQAALAESAAEVAALGAELHERLGTMGNHFDRVGRSLGTAVKAYNSTVGSLESRVMVTARRFGELSVTKDELQQLKPSNESIKPLTAPELVEDAGQIEQLLGRERGTSSRSTADDAPALPNDERQALTRGEPDLDELVSDPVTRLEQHKRSLG